MIEGRWDAIVKLADRDYASWFEINNNGALSGRFVGIEGSARPITEVTFKENELYFRLPPQYEKRDFDLIFKGVLDEEKITGKTNDDEGNWVEFNAVRAPNLEYHDVEWGDPINLIKDDLSNWKQRFSEIPSGWKIENGILSNMPPSVDIVTKEKYSDFKLHAEWRVPENGNSGIYLRGRYEAQILDDHNRELSDRSTGSIYGYLKPSKKVTKPAGEWNTGEIMVYDGTVVHFMNGEKVLEYHLWTSDWYEMIKGSKFPEYNENWAEVAKQGVICLQDHGHEDREREPVAHAPSRDEEQDGPRGQGRAR